jgi:hypothetical protein
MIALLLPAGTRLGDVGAFVMDFWRFTWAKASSGACSDHHMIYFSLLLTSWRSVLNSATPGYYYVHFIVSFSMSKQGGLFVSYLLLTYSDAKKL